MHTHEKGHKHEINLKKVDRISPTKVRLTVSMPEDTVRSHEKALVQKYANSAKIPGFRPGKAPAEMVRKQYKDSIQQDLVSHLVEAGLAEAVEQSKLMPLNRPQLKLGEWGEGKNLEFEAEFEVAPEIELRNYKAISLVEPELVVSDDEVTSTLDNLRERLAVLEPSDAKKPTKGDFAIVEMTYTVDGPTPKSEGPKTYTFEVGAGKLLDGLEKALLEMEVGETRNVSDTFPADYPDKVLAEKKTTFDCKVLELKKKVLPALDDSFAKQVKEGLTLETLKTEIRETIAAEKKEAANRDHRQQVVDHLIKNHSFEVPVSLVDQQAASLAQWVDQDLKARGVHPGKITQADLEGIRKRAEGMVRSSLLLREVAVKEKISLNEEKLKEKIDSIAKQLNRSSEETEKLLTGNGNIGRVKDEVLTEQVFDYLIQNATLQKAPKKKEKQA